MVIFFHAWLLLPSQCVCRLSAAGPGLDQSGFDGEEIIGVHLICTEGRQNHQVWSWSSLMTSYTHWYQKQQL